MRQETDQAVEAAPEKPRKIRFTFKPNPGSKEGGVITLLFNNQYSAESFTKKMQHRIEKTEPIK